ncbi:hypothetical protein HXX76_009614 [Chlamydomonas incerta]|uniref:tRNA-5-taurinomethyluridine 2-sulfurtransferase n=1 Tax=Chlamydomonas incerta TaxID=51695 RepID=A0A835VZW1_CHLIN|nr:hypothetical protein HXX76_009614 [Chlamydomonas incerta]|eukprot:KAG2431081.1 hypothetical protein HXX76_009614 [Chlamydomonas incerta]
MDIRRCSIARYLTSGAPVSAALVVKRRCGEGVGAAPATGAYAAPAAARRRASGVARVAGLSEIPTSSTPLLQLPTRGVGDKGVSDQYADDGYVAPPPEEWAQHPMLMAGCEPGKRLRVAVLLSGGVDSSLALRLLVAAGHAVTAFYLQIWFQEDFRNFWDACPWEEDLEYARKVCDALGVKLEVVPLTTAYWDRVVSASVAEIRAGRTPNPDIWCNSRVKFGAFYDHLAANHGAEFDRVASGHYARVERVAAGGGGSAGVGVGGAGGQEVEEERRRSGGLAAASGRDHHGLRQHDGAAAGSLGAAQAGSARPAGAAAAAVAAAAGGPGAWQARGEAGAEEVRLLLTPDAVKDQTYFLAGLSPGQLARVMFPLGCLTKSQVRKLAAAADLANKNRKDSQGICFLGKVRFSEFVKEHLGEWPGPLLEAETGVPLGTHAGYWFYTVGQRGGIKLPGGPWYVVAKDTARNVVLVSRHYYEGGKARNAFTCGPFNWLHPTQRPRLGAAGSGGGGAVGPAGPSEPLFVKVRHGPNMYRCTLWLHDSSGAPIATSSGSSNGSSSSHSSSSSAVAGVRQQQQEVENEGEKEVYGTVVLEANDQGLAPGQYAVFYQGGACLGSAVITGTGLDAAALAAAGLVPPPPVTAAA